MDKPRLAAPPDPLADECRMSWRIRDTQANGAAPMEARGSRLARYDSGVEEVVAMLDGMPPSIAWSVTFVPLGRAPWGPTGDDLS